MGKTSRKLKRTLQRNLVQRCLWGLVAIVIGWKALHEEEHQVEESAPVQSVAATEGLVARNGSSTKIAIVVPVRLDGGTEIWERVMHLLMRWESFKPCSESFTNKLKVVFMYGAPDDKTSEGQTEFNRNMLELAWKQSEIANKCFSQPQIISVALTPKQNKHPDCTCVLFRKTHGILRELGYHHWFQMETDVMPVQQDWATSLLQRAESNRGCSEFWMHGSLPMCDVLKPEKPENGPDFHINGNALYCLEDLKFDRYMRLVRGTYEPAAVNTYMMRHYERRLARYHEEVLPQYNLWQHKTGGTEVTAGGKVVTRRRPPPPLKPIPYAVAGCATGRQGEAGFDHALYRCRSRDCQWEGSTMTALQVNRKFRADGELIVNKCEEIYTIDAVRRAHPTALFVHSKSVFFSPPEAQFVAAYRNIFGRNPPKNIAQHGVARLAARVATEWDLWEELCSYAAAAKASVECAAVAKARQLQALEQQRLSLSAKSSVASATSAFTTSPPLYKLALPYTHWSPRYPGRAYVWATDQQSGPHGLACNLPIYEAAGAVVGSAGRQLDAAELARMDAVICSRPAAACQQYTPFNKTLVAYVTTWRELGSRQLGALRRIATAHKGMLVAGDPLVARYLQHSAGMKAAVLPAWCGAAALARPPKDNTPAGRSHSITLDVNPRFYSPSRRQLLVAPLVDTFDSPLAEFVEGVPATASRPDIRVYETLVGELREAAEAHGPCRSRLRLVGGSMLCGEGDKGYEVASMPQLHPSSLESALSTPSFSLSCISDLGTFPAVVLLPFGLSATCLLQYYRLNVPLYAPSLNLLTRWQARYGLVQGWAEGPPESATPTMAAPPQEGDSSPLHTNDPQSFQWWARLSDIYNLPHVQVFESWAQLLDQLDATSPTAVSAAMADYNMRQRHQLEDRWREIFQNARRRGPVYRRG